MAHNFTIYGFLHPYIIPIWPLNHSTLHMNSKLTILMYLWVSHHFTVLLELSSKGPLRKEKNWLKTSFHHVFIMASSGLRKKTSFHHVFIMASSGLRKMLYLIVSQLHRWHQDCIIVLIWHVKHNHAVQWQMEYHPCIMADGETICL